MALEFNKSTDTEHEIQLESELVAATWRARSAIAGQEAMFEVRTAFVGSGAQIKIKGKSEGGKSLGRVKGEMLNNVFIGALSSPSDIEPDDLVYFEVELSGNGISGESNRIPVWLVEVTNMRWSAGEARRGDTLTLSADISGVPNETEVTVTIYEYDGDGIHDKISELPTMVKDEKIELLWEYEYHEDTDELPTEEELQKYGKSYNPPEYFFTIKVADMEFGKEQESGLLEFKDWIEIYLKDDAGNPIADEDFIAHLPDGSEQRGKTNSDGCARLEGIPPGTVTMEYPNAGEVSLEQDTGEQ
ncbi:MAG: carboxypeptidase regulatory-like domain-containing protein [Candidatus Zixiibacteriota bacterium]|nr:MAG: carboxypeptidase regulatory-like domain-containing protein [candidate division Zixibacteria bacterium]